ncbi:MAG: Na+/H+ antiporter subunit D, partial [Candidatus Altiarchaeales archaeon]
MMINIIPLPPYLIFIVGASLIPLLRGRVRNAYLLLIPVIAFINLLYMPNGNYWNIEFWGMNLITGRVDLLSKVFAYVFVIMSFIGNLYAL